MNVLRRQLRNRLFPKREELPTCGLGDRASGDTKTLALIHFVVDQQHALRGEQHL